MLRMSGCGPSLPAAFASPATGGSSAASTRRPPRFPALARAALACVLALAELATPALAQTTVPSGWSLTPDGLTAGAQFRLLFLSSTKRDGSVTTIATYNTFIQNLAAAGHADIQAYSTGFRVVGCTADVDARDNTSTTGTGVPIYWLGGAKVADTYADFYDGDWDDEANDKNESGTDGPDTSLVANFPFTGCDHDGTEVIESSVSRALGSIFNVRTGRPNSSTTGHGPISSDSAATPSTTRPMYGLSAVFQVGADTTPPTLSSAFVRSSGQAIQFRFSENLQVSNLPPASAFTVTAGGSAVTVSGITAGAFPNVLNLRVSPFIRQSQAVVVTYTDPTASDDTNAIQDTAGNDVATFTTGLNSVPAVTNNSTVDTTPPTLTRAAVPTNGLSMVLEFSENVDRSNRPPAAAVMVTADGSAVTVSGVLQQTALDAFRIVFSPTIRQGQAVVVTYTDPTDRQRHQRHPGRSRQRRRHLHHRHERRPRRHQRLHRDAHRTGRPDRPHGHRQRDHPDRPRLERPGAHRPAPPSPATRSRPPPMAARRGPTSSPTPAAPPPPTRTPGLPPAPRATTASRPSTRSAPASPRTSPTPPPGTTGQTTVTFGASFYTAVEGGAAATVTVELSAAPSASVTIPLTTEHLGNATAADHSSIPATVTFGVGEQTKTFTVTATNDSDEDGGESVRLGFGTLPAGYAPGAQRTATVALADDDARLAVDFGTSADGTHIEVRESRDVRHRFTVHLSQWQQPINAQQAMTIPLEVSYQDGATAADHTAIPASVTIAVGESEAAFSMRAIPDQTIEIGERLRIDFGALPAGVRTGDWGPYETVAFVDGLVPSQATVTDTTLVLTYTTDLNSASAPFRSDFTVTVDNTRVEVDQVRVGGSTVTLTLATAVESGQTVTLDYTQGANRIRDVEGNAAVSFFGWVVTNTLSGGGTDPPGGGGDPPVTVAVTLPVTVVVTLPVTVAVAAALTLPVTAAAVVAAPSRNRSQRQTRNRCRPSRCSGSCSWRWAWRAQGRGSCVGVSASRRRGARPVGQGYPSGIGTMVLNGTTVQRLDSCRRAETSTDTDDDGIPIAGVAVTVNDNDTDGPREPAPVPALPVAGAIGRPLLLLGTGGRARRGRAKG